MDTIEEKLVKLSDTFEHCIRINNEYKLKHEELKEIYKAYKTLVDNCDNEYVHEHLFEILNDIDHKLITKENLKEMIVDQSNIMREFNDINVKIQELFPNYS